MKDRRRETGNAKAVGLTRFLLSSILARAAISGLFACVTIGFSAPAAAHLGLEYPPSRYGPNVLKIGPCGVEGGSRSSNVTVLEAGATIEVVWDEYVDHPGHYRIAFDSDGDDAFVDPKCTNGCNSRTPSIERYSNAAVLLDGIADETDRASVTLPDIECERCTLQVIQVMYDKPPYVLPGDDIYYQCADLVLRRSAPPPTATVTATATATFTPSPEPTATATCGTAVTAACPECGGDCDGNLSVNVDELLTMVTIALGSAPASECARGDLNADGLVYVDEIVVALQHSLHGCPQASAF
jgi:hypothetical protein